MDKDKRYELTGEFNFIVDYQPPSGLETIARAENHINTQNCLVAGYFSSFKGEKTGEVEVEACLLRVEGMLLHGDDIDVILNKLGLRPSGVEELLFFGKCYPKEQMISPIMATEKPRKTDFNDLYPVLVGYGGHRSLAFLDIFKMDSSARILVLRK